MSTSPRLAVVTGAGSGIGRALTRSLLDQGFDVVAIDRDIAAVDLRAQAHRIDVRDAAGMQRIAEDCAARPLHYCLTNAGIGAPGGVLASNHEAWQWAWDVNVAAVLRTLRLWWPHLVAGGGKAVATVSAEALQSYPRFTHPETMDWIEQRQRCIRDRTAPFSGFGSAP